ncbi:MAG TPA: SDR family NAD(P)-dependent oxidoreductase [Acidimicrobiales bacterium]|nr:SDR family NAD(P)-dependent oxidoreductase [Acidimicrobiales bacterium]
MARTTVVTGAASGIGAAVVELLSAGGDRVIGVDRADAEVVADLSTADGRRAMVEQVDTLSGGRVDAVVANAGVMGNDTGAIVAVNFFGAVATLGGLQPYLAASDAPRAVATASVALLQGVDPKLVALCLAGDEPAALEHVARAGVDPLAGYASTKRALARWIRARAVEPEWAGAGIALNAVAPGVVRTPMTAPLLADEAMSAVLLDLVPMPLGGVADPAAIARLLVTFTRPELAAVTGQVLFADAGGECVQRGDDVWGRGG